MLSGTQRRSRARPKKERDRVVVAIAKLLRMLGVVFYIIRELKRFS